MTGKKRNIAVSGLCVIVIIASAIFYSSQRDTKIIIKLKERKPKDVLKNGRLAALPASAANIKAQGWNSPFSGVDYLMFKASPQDIEKFISESKSLTQPKIFNENHQYLQQPNDAALKNTDANYQNEFFIRTGGWPQWFDPTIRQKGRLYEIPEENSHNWGQIIINDETNTVYIWVCWS